MLTDNDNGLPSLVLCLSILGFFTRRRPRDSQISVFKCQDLQVTSLNFTLKVKHILY